MRGGQGSHQTCMSSERIETEQSLLKHSLQYNISYKYAEARTLGDLIKIEKKKKTICKID